MKLFKDHETGEVLAAALHCDLCGTEIRHRITKEFDGRRMDFCCRSCLEMYELLRVEDLVQTEDNFLPLREKVFQVI